MVKIVFLGTGTSQGVPIIGCRCDVCISDDTKDKRLRTSVFVEWDGFHFVIDSGPDFRQQMLRLGIDRLDGLVFTHGHKDHVAGMDDIRAFNYTQKGPVDVYADANVQKILKGEFPYIFDDLKYPGVPEINLHTIDAQPFQIKGKRWQPVEVLHYRLPVLGFRLQDFTYITDANFISDEEIKKIKGSKILVLNALRLDTHISHFSLNQAIEVARKCEAEQTYFTHISHQLGRHHEISLELPTGMHLAYDQLSLTL